uniref:Uncharacterized protein n=1 Tax=Chromera velia CCMP2878 TaxID=1169474 RepID=A0A0G4HZQ3_9ALVE|eukprot:Cvel_34003.t1-p1 / transcript=Cvel_34003.t1 / gene=Cvel_34003 / organism=Chromera_velia_CCMP2878 / gene_product=hypothetical protein / transcript_product=hypothetical protein / location=Cvel_scaffold5700:294-938(-) / protein_length=175 / sequence_SO=supercontig / SO=protein_coding / is_pseudo=false
MQEPEGGVDRNQRPGAYQSDVFDSERAAGRSWCPDPFQSEDYVEFEEESEDYVEFEEESEDYVEFEEDGEWEDEDFEKAEASLCGVDEDEERCEETEEGEDLSEESDTEDFDSLEEEEKRLEECVRVCLDDWAECPEECRTLVTEGDEEAGISDKALEGCPISKDYYEEVGLRSC